MKSDTSKCWPSTFLCGFLWLVLGGWAPPQGAEAAVASRSGSSRLSPADLDRIFADLWLLAVLVAVVTGFLGIQLLRRLPHQKGLNFPEQVRWKAAQLGCVGVVFWESVFVIKSFMAADWSIGAGLSAWLSLQHFILLFMFGLIWAFVTVFSSRLPPRWSGSTALLPSNVLSQGDRRGER